VNSPLKKGKMRDSKVKKKIGSVLDNAKGAESSTEQQKGGGAQMGVKKKGDGGTEELSGGEKGQEKYWGFFIV